MVDVWTRVKTYYGFRKPYDFNVAIPALLNLAFFLLLATKFISALNKNNGVRIYGPVKKNFLTFPSEMYYFYIYIFIGLILLNVFIRNRRLYWPLFAWFIIEFCLGVWGRGLSPFDARTEFDDRYEYHALLQGVPQPNFKAQQLDLVIAHNALGQRDAGNSTNDLRRNGLLYVFGGSTTYDPYVSQGETWVEKLNVLLGRPYRLFNFGVPGYNTSEHVIQTAFYADIDDVYPLCAIYYIGWNDIRNAYVANLDAGYANFHTKQLSVYLNTRRAMHIATVSPVLKLAVKGIAYLIDTIPFASPERDESEEGKSNAPLMAIFKRNVATITAINKSRDVKTIFVGQILNRQQIEDQSANKKRHAWLPFLETSQLWTMQSQFNELLKANAASIGYTYIDADVDKFNASDFVDAGHFTAGGAEKFASRIADDVRRACPSS